MDQYILLGHGSRNSEANEVLYNLADMFEQEVQVPTSCAFLQFAEPNLETVMEESYSKQLRNITIIPVFLYPGVHIKKDVPNIIDKIQTKYNGLTIKIADHIGADSKLVSILMERAEKASTKVTRGE